MSAIFEDALQQSLHIIRENMNTLTEFPESFQNGCWNPVEKERDAGNWVDGFWTGLLWLAYAHTDDAAFKAGAIDWTERLAFMKTRTGTHDLGFIFHLSHVLGGRITDDTALFENAIAAASTLIQRYKPRGEYLQAWDDDGIHKWAGRMNVDLMMNLSLLYWTSARTDDATFADIATCHARTSRLALVRRDGSTAQLADFDPETGLLLRQEQYQGYSYDSCWSRGQAWALYGFATCHRYTQIESFLMTAQALAEYTEANLPDDLVPFWDYDSPHVPNTYRDSSAAAVTACGLIELAACDPANAQRWRDLAERILVSLCQNYMNRDVKEASSILREGARSVPHRVMDHGLIYGDYYFMEALTAFLRPDIHDVAFAIETN
ncbi:MAG: glycoside hydrolase family 88 protein [Aggregatilineales bacterium]